MQDRCAALAGEAMVRDQDTRNLAVRGDERQRGSCQLVMAAGQRLLFEKREVSQVVQADCPTGTDWLPIGERTL
jgi:hypothetical protein